MIRRPVTSQGHRYAQFQRALRSVKLVASDNRPRSWAARQQRRALSLKIGREPTTARDWGGRSRRTAAPLSAWGGVSRQSRAEQCAQNFAVFATRFRHRGQYR